METVIILSLGTFVGYVVADSVWKRISKVAGKKKSRKRGRSKRKR